jgi:hypothetical protein
MVHKKVAGIGDVSIVLLVIRTYVILGGEMMKVVMLFPGSGPVVIITSHESVTDPKLLEKLAAKGINKFIAYEIPVELAKERYGGHYDVVIGDLHETDDLRVLDYDGMRAFKLFRLSELGEPVLYEGAA